MARKDPDKMRARSVQRCAIESGHMLGLSTTFTEPRHIRLAGLISVTFFLTLMPAAKGQLLANMNLEQEISASYVGQVGPELQMFQYANTSTIPFHTMVSASEYGASLTGTYDITDNGSVAVLSIYCSGSLSVYGAGLGESYGPANKKTTFTLLQPAYVTLNVVSTGQSYASSSMYGQPGQILEDGSNGLTSSTFSPATITFEDSWSVGNTSYAPNQSGTYSMTLTFTAIPEPSSASLIGIPAAAFLLRRRRTIRSQSAGTTRPPGN